MLGDPQQPFDVLAVWGISSILGLRSIIMHPPRQRFHRQHAHPVRSQQISKLCLTELLRLPVRSDDRRLLWYRQTRWRTGTRWRLKRNRINSCRSYTCRLSNSHSRTVILDVRLHGTTRTRP